MWINSILLQRGAQSAPPGQNRGMKDIIGTNICIVIFNAKQKSLYNFEKKINITLYFLLKS